ncbi:MAG TPA: hypothetical protein VGR67_14335 [Candidatus Polarisedimenticolia bacterium]|jgi:hypothetical protein|nr:hypothetical protein [Candidatus Polarisedimenticolia bacterium]
MRFVRIVLTHFGEGASAVVRSCILPQAVFLGFISGDLECPPLSAEKVAAPVEEFLPREDALPGLLKKLEETPAPIDEWCDFDSEPEIDSGSVE